MGRKNPWVAAILNFLLPGIGFIYCGTTPFIIGGAILFIISIWATVTSYKSMFEASTLILSFLPAIFWAALGYVAAEYVNKQMLPPMPSPVAVPPSTSTAVPQEKIYCVYCGAENPADAVFCRKCGKKITKPI
jgi:4-amino-4-deoxy-L-arabinose transferase-like glycosyltransferase